MILLYKRSSEKIHKETAFTFQFGDFTIDKSKVLMFKDKIFTFQFGDFTIGLILYIEITML